MTVIDFVPWGKCTETYNKTTQLYDFQCQHGLSECQGNWVMACAIAALYNYDPFAYVPFVLAFEFALSTDGWVCANQNIYGIAQDVCQDNPELNCDWDDLHECLNSKQLNDIYHEMGQKTPSELNWTPWIVINDEHNQNEQNDCESYLLHCTCEVYQDQSHNTACTNNNVSVSTHY
jgi:hypothetical protein